MKKLFVVGSSFMVVASVAVGCVQHANFSSTDDEIETLQNPKGCLDISRVNERILKSKESRSTLVDVKYDKTPSDLLVMNLQDLLKDSDSQPKSTPSDSLKQSGCSSVSDASLGSEGDREITKSARLSAQVGNTKYEMEGPNRVRETIVMPDSANHVCDGQQVEETANQTLVYVIDFGDKLPAKPAESAELTTLRAEVKRVSDRVDGDQSKLIDDADECAKLPSGAN